MKYAVKLKDNPKFRKNEGLFVCEGLRLCRDVAVTSGRVETVFATEAFMADFAQDFALICHRAQTVYPVSEGVMQKLSDTASPQGIVCLCRVPEFGALPQKAGRFAVLENVADPGNLGTVARTAEALGIDGLLLAGGCDPYSPKALRASMGALIRLPVYRAELAEICRGLQALKVPVLGAVVSGAVHKADFLCGQKQCAVMIGNEASGLTQAAVSLCDATVTIPMTGRAESLNAAAAATILLWEMSGRGE